MEWGPVVTLLSCAELMALVTRSADITLAFKNATERTESEQERVRRGLRKELGLDFVLYVPASAVLLMLTVKPMLPPDLMAHAYSNALLGAVAYAFPFTAFKRAAVFAILRSLKGFMEVLSESEKADLMRQLEKAESHSRPTGGSSVSS